MEEICPKMMATAMDHVSHVNDNCHFEPSNQWTASFTDLNLHWFGSCQDNSTEVPLGTYEYLAVAIIRFRIDVRLNDDSYRSDTAGDRSIIRKNKSSQSKANAILLLDAASLSNYLGPFLFLDEHATCESTLRDENRIPDG